MSHLHLYEFNTEMPTNQSNALAIEDYIGFGSVKDATRITKEIFLDERNAEYIAKTTYKGYEVSWSVYNAIFRNFSLPFTEIKQLITQMRGAKTITVHKIPKRYIPVIKHCFFQNNVEWLGASPDFQKTTAKEFLVQAAAAIFGVTGFLFFLISRRKVALRTSDKIAKGKDCDFRLTELYAQLRKQNIPFVEFVRIEKFKNIFQNINLRKRPVIYYEPIRYLLSFFIRERRHIPHSVYQSVFSSYDESIRVTKTTIPVYVWMFKLLGIKSFWYGDFSLRNAALAIAAKSHGIKTVGIKSGAGTKDYDVSEFLPGFSGEKSLGPEKYGLWSEWWTEYFKAHSRFTHKESAINSGLLRPHKNYGGALNTPSSRDVNAKIRVLVLSEPLTNPAETAPFLRAIDQDSRFELSIKIRPSVKDVFYEGLKKIMPESENWNVYDGNIFEDGEHADVFLGAHTTALLEGALMGKLPVFIRTEKWGDYFDMETLVPEMNMLVKQPEMLPQHIVSRIKKEPALQSIKKINARFFGTNENGAEWAAKELGSV